MIPNPTIVDGRSANMVLFGTSDSNQLGHYRQTGLRSWEEVDTANNVTFRFTEQQRDEWSVYLHDPSRDVFLQLDLHRKRIVYRHGSDHFDLYQITDALAKVNGWMVNYATFGSLAGRKLGHYRQTGASSWVEFNKTGDPTFRFEEIQRDQWSVYLRDSSRNVNIQIDLHRAKVVYSDAGTPRTDLYAVTGAQSVQEEAVLTPPLTGQSVNVVDFGSVNSDPLGQLRQTGPFTWVETDREGEIRFYFVETKRHNGAVYLYDPSRSVTLELHIASKQVIYSDAAANRFVLYSILDGRSKINGWVVNRVAFRTFDGVPLGEYRQTGETTWVELNAQQRVNFRFAEVQRDEWSVYLHDGSRNVSLQLDLHTQKVLYSDTSRSRLPLYAIERAGSDPAAVVARSPIPVKAKNARTIAFGGLDGRPLGTYRQIKLNTWVEVDANHEIRFTFTETKRDHETIYLRDDSRGVSLALNVRTQRIHYSDAKQSFVLYTILRSSAMLNGWLVSEATYGSWTGERLGELRQTGDSVWVEFDKAGKAAAHFQETRREDWSIFLQDATRAVTLQLDLRRQQIFYTDRSNNGVALYQILSESVETGLWLHSEKITSRSSMTEDFAATGAGGKLTPKPVFRTSVTVTAVTSAVDVWASEEVTVEINGTSYTIDPVKAAHVKPSKLNKLSISIPATDVSCPSLLLRTDLMMPEQRHHIFPDVEAHKKIVGLKDGDLFRAKAQLGIPDEISQDDLDHFQRGLQNVAKTVQHTYNATPHGVHHDRALHPANMEHPHFVLDFAGGTRYRPLHPSEVAQHIAGAQRLQGDAALGFFDDVGNFFKKATHVVVHTIESVGHDIVQTVENVGSDVVHTVEQVGEDIIHGDIDHIGQDLLRGGENIGKDLVKGASQVAGDVVSGAGQLIVLTVHAAEEAVQFVLTHTGVVGKALGWLFEKIGAGLTKVVDWLLDKIGWGDVLHAHDVLLESFNRHMDEMIDFPRKLEARSDQFFTHLSNLISSDIDKTIAQLDVNRHPKQLAPVASHSGAVEKIEWLMSKLMHHSSSASDLIYPSLPDSHNALLDKLANLVEQQLGQDGEKIIGAIEHAIGDIGSVFTDPEHGPEYLLAAMLEIVKAVAILSLDALKVVLDLILEIIATVLEGFKSMMNAPWHIPFIEDLYSMITEGRQLSFLSFSCLLIAMPLTIISKAEFGEPAFQAQTAATALNELPSKVRSWGIAYGIFHIILAPVAIVTDARTAAGAVDVGSDQIAGIEADPNAIAEFSKADLLLTALNLGLGVFAQLAAAPIPAGDPYVIPLDHAKEDVFEAPNYWAHVIWWFQWAGWGLNLVASGAVTIAGGVGAKSTTVKKMGNVTTVFNCAWGIVHMALMSVLDAADRRKREALTLLDTTYYLEENIDQNLHVTERFAELTLDEKKEILRASHPTAEFPDYHVDQLSQSEIDQQAKSMLRSFYLFKQMEENLIEDDHHQPYWSFSEQKAGPIPNGVQNFRVEFWSNGLNPSMWEANARNYYAWAKDTSSGQGIPNKGFGNVMDTFPEIGQIGAMPAIADETFGLSLIGTALFDTLGHLGEGITYITRTANDALL